MRHPDGLASLTACYNMGMSDLAPCSKALLRGHPLEANLVTKRLRAVSEVSLRRQTEPALFRLRKMVAGERQII